MTTFAFNTQQLLCEINVVKGQSRELGTSQACVDEQPQNSSVAPIFELAPRAIGEHSLQLMVGEDVWGSFRNLRCTHTSHRRAFNLLFVNKPIEKASERFEPCFGRRGRSGCEQLLNVGLDLFASHASWIEWLSVFLHVSVEGIGCIGIYADRVRAAVLSFESPHEASPQGLEGSVEGSRVFRNNS